MPRTFFEYLDQSLWKGDTQAVLSAWSTLKPNQPIQITPIPLDHKGTRYDDDGIRLTGRGEFINSVLSRLKDLLAYDKYPNTEIDIEYRQISNKEAANKGGYPLQTPHYVCYLHVVQKKPKIPKHKTFKPFSSKQ